MKLSTIVLIFITFVLCGCGVFQPAKDGSHVGVAIGGETNDVPSAAIATTASWLFSTVLGVSIPPSASIPVTAALIGAWWWIRNRRTKRTESTSEPEK